MSAALRPRAAVPRRIVHLIDTTGPGGAETVFVGLARELAGRGYESIPVVTASHGWVHDAVRDAGFAPIVEPTAGAFDLRYLARLTSRIRAARADLVQAHLLTANVYGSLAGRISGVPVVSTFHGQVDVDAGDRRLPMKCRAVNTGSRAIVFVSEHLRRTMLAATRLDARRSHTIHNGVAADLAPFPDTALRRSLGVPDEAFLVGAVGNVRPAKAYDVMLRAAAVLVARGAPVHVAIAGDASGPLYDQLLAQRAALGLEGRVHFLGFRADVRSMLAAVDLYLLTSSSEGFSISTIEAMACGRPIVATRSGGPEEILRDGETGLLVPVGEPEAIADAVDALRRDPARRARLADAGRAAARARFSLDAMVDAYENLYARVCARGAKDA